MSSGFALVDSICLFLWLCGDFLTFSQQCEVLWSDLRLPVERRLPNCFHCVWCVDFHVLDMSSACRRVCCKWHWSQEQLYLCVCYAAIDLSLRSSHAGKRVRMIITRLQSKVKCWGLNLPNMRLYREALITIDNDPYFQIEPLWMNLRRIKCFI